MQVIYLPKAKEDLDFWLKSGDKKVLDKIVKLTEAILENPYSGVGKPEPLRYKLSGKWSRRITHTDRYVYSIKDNTLYIYPFAVIMKNEI